MSVHQDVTTSALALLKARGEKIVMVTAYDFVSGSVAEAAGVDIVLVGDSAATTVLGYESTRLVSVEEMLMLAGAVRRAITTPLLVGDLPFGSYESSDALAVATARRFADVGCDAVKIEGAGPIVDRARAIVAAGIPVMGHVGLTPQHSVGVEGFRVHGKTTDDALEILRGSLALEAAGCFSLVFEAIPATVAELLVPRLHIPVIGIGAGAAPDGQVLVFADLVGLYDVHVPKFVKRYAEAKHAMIDAVTRYAAEVRGRVYPDAAHVYKAEAAELEQLRAALEQREG